MSKRKRAIHERTAITSTRVRRTRRKQRTRLRMRLQRTGQQQKRCNARAGVVPRLFNALRRHRGLATQRHWSQRASERTLPCLLGLFSLVTPLADTLHGAALPTRQSAWYAKPEATFLDALAAVRRHPWTSRQANTPTPIHAADMADSPDSLFAALVDAACYAA